MKHIRLTAGLLCAALLMGACGAPAPDSSSIAEAPVPLAAGTGSLTGKADAAPDEAAAQAVNQFGMELMGQLYTPDKNVFFSPVSVYLAMGMVRSGADGETAAQLEKALGVTGMDELNTLCRDLQLYLTGDRGSTDIRMANSLWMRDSAAPTVLPSFVQNVTDYYGAKAQALDFGDPAAADTINGWVSENTGGLIEKMIDGVISPDTMMYLINTVLFEGKWAVPFDTEATAAGMFRSPGGDVEAQMMHGKVNGSYWEDDSLQAALLPYEDGKTSLLVVLPKEGRELASLAAGRQELSALLGSMAQEEITLTLPRLDVSYDTQLNDALTAMGVEDAFSTRADLSGITGDKSLYVSSVSHKAVLKVDEKGTKAAGATDVAISRMSLMEPVVLTVDRPFYTAVVDNATGLLLFGGVIVTPS